MPFLSSLNDGVRLRVYVQPKASKTRLVGLHDGMLKIGVTAPPIDGKANKEIVKILSKCLRTSKADIAISSGLQSRRKTVTIVGLTPEEIRRQLEPLLHDVK